MSSIRTAYISASANRFGGAADSSPSNLVAFGSSKLVALWNVGDETDRGVFETLPGHQGAVTCVRCIGEDGIVSADDQGYIRYWRRIQHKWTCTANIRAHPKSISALCVHEQYIATGSSDALVKVWEFETAEGTDAIKEIQTIPLKGKYPLSLALASFPQSKATVLAIGGTDRNVQIWTRSEATFVRSAVLSGHEDWIRSLVFRPPSVSSDPLVLASGSQDGTIRLWNIEPFTRNVPAAQILSEEPLSDELLDAFEAALGDLTDAEEGGRQISLKRHVVTVKSDSGGAQKFSITFDALLVGHDAGVTCLSWRPSLPGVVPTLLSTSTDSSLILWSPSDITTSSGENGTSAIWINRQRFGDVGGQRLGGFVGGLWAQNGSEASAWGWSGGWRRWRLDSSGGHQATETWSEIGAISGHNGPVKSVQWSPEGQYAISASVDQTTRIHGAIPVTSKDGTTAPVWHEIGRPQVHGYDLLGVGFLDALKFVSIADEKVARVFEAPHNFVDVVNGLAVAELNVDKSTRALSASVPPLGLSNKAISSTRDEGDDAYVERGSERIRRPFEGELASATLWPEIEKVFGHGYESISLAVSPSRKFIATSCKATTAEHAVVRIYETNTWQPVGRPLEGHSLTVTRIAFSPDDRYVLTVSRDRSWRLFETHAEEGFIPVAADKSHARIIWDCAWAHEGDVFATASRDKTVKIWHRRDDKWMAIATIKAKDAATAVAFNPRDKHGRRRLAIGLETGEVLIYCNAPTSEDQWTLEYTMDSKAAHVDHVHQIAWRPTQDGAPQELATCSEDGTLKVSVYHVVDGFTDNPR
ncbi:hypothetical protein PLICRDRAFT_33611 [Plicaturopsis crispa FD-325 SS-3]|nr:hypothetical protein PLICRDRAFT_33611 [Plicaturopsis crispa FD-325 SS-3]